METWIDTDWRGNLFCIRNRTEELFHKQCWTDVSFAIFDEAGQQKQIIKAHKVILANASEVFEKMFFGSIPEDTSRDIPIDDITPETFSAMMKYIYTDEVAVDSWQNVAELFCAAKKYMLHALAQYCVDLLRGSLTSANALEIYEFANFHELNNLLEAAMKIIVNQTSAVIKSPFMKNLKLITLTTIVEQEILNASEIELFNAVELIAKHKGVIKNDRKDLSYNSAKLQNSPQWIQFHDIVKQIRFLSMSVKVFIEGPGFSALLLSDEAFAITACLANPKSVKSNYPKEFVQKRRTRLKPRVFFDISSDKSPIGRIVMELRSDVVPKSAENFLSLCTGEKNLGYKNSVFYYINKFACLGEAINFATGDRVGAQPCDQENFKLKHSKAGILGMVNTTTTGKSCQNTFYITFDHLPTWDNRCVVIGEVVKGLNVLKKIQTHPTHVGSSLSREFRITNCGKLP